ncbi:MAG: hypothetical protein KKI09_03560 [Spirochaetes bacterium]|nr:hypothetical protein [Spirochaetota bacterium]
MQTLLVLFSALAVYGVGITLVDMFGVFDQLGQEDASADDADDSGDDDSADDIGDSGDTALTGDDSSAADDDDAGDNDDADDGGHGHSLLVYENQTKQATIYQSRAEKRGEKGTKAVAKAIGLLRSSVYFSLGAGPTGLFGLLTGQAIGATLGWSAGAGIFVTVIAKLLRRFLRRDLDSSIGAEEYLMDLGTISIPVLPGQIGKVLVRRYNREVELYVKAKDPAAMLAKGTSVRIIDMNDEVYFVEEA